MPYSLVVAHSVAAVHAEQTPGGVGGGPVERKSGGCEIFGYRVDEAAEFTVQVL